MEERSTSHHSRDLLKALRTIMHDGFYSSKPWLKVRAKVLKRDGYKCVLCGESVHGKGMARVDHYPHSRRDRPDLALVMENLRTLDSKCDNLQSIARGQRFNLAPKDEINSEGYPESWR
jgi:5-methylcytosine-specific restriction endonuclease McrA